MFYEHLNQAQNPVKSILLSDSVAEESFKNWLPKFLRPHQDLATNSYDPNVIYVNQKQTEFTTLHGTNEKYITVGTLALWSWHYTQNIHYKLNKHPDLFNRLGVVKLTDSTTRSNFALDRHMFKYARLSSNLVLITPRAAAALLLISKNERCDSYRSYIQDQRPELPYMAKKLTSTYLNFTNLNV